MEACEISDGSLENFVQYLNIEIKCEKILTMYPPWFLLM